MQEFLLLENSRKVLMFSFHSMSMNIHRALRSLQMIRTERFTKTPRSRTVAPCFS